MTTLHLHLRGFANASLPLVALWLLTALGTTGRLDWGWCVGGAYFLGHMSAIFLYARRR